MANEVNIFERPEFGKIRVLLRAGEPWFVARDVCVCLWLENTAQALSCLDEDETTLIINEGFNDFSDLRKDMKLVSESGLYSLILRSRKPEAREFRRWVTREVIPSIRKTGSYTIAGVPVPNFSSPAEAARAWADAYEKSLALEAKNKELDQYNEALEVAIGNSIQWKSVTGIRGSGSTSRTPRWKLPRLWGNSSLRRRSGADRKDCRMGRVDAR